jgi:hypothetical protein
LGYESDSSRYSNIFIDIIGTIEDWNVDLHIKKQTDGKEHWLKDYVDPIVESKQLGGLFEKEKDLSLKIY